MLFKRIALTLILIIFTLSFTACFNLGEIENEEEYYSTYNSIKLIDSNGNYVNDYSIDEFYSVNSVNSFACPISYDELDSFCYMIIGIAKDVNIGEFALYFNSNSAEKLSVSFFLLNSNQLPTKIKTNSNNVNLEETDEPDDENIIAQTSVNLKGGQNNWNSIVIKQWKVGDNKYSKKLAVKSGQNLVLRFDNNCYDLALRKFNKVKTEYEVALAEYNEAKTNYDNKNIEYNSSNSEEEKSELWQELITLNNVLVLKTQIKNELKTKFDNAKEVYEKEKDIENSLIAIRMTNILIYTQKGA